MRANMMILLNDRCIMKITKSISKLSGSIALLLLITLPLTACNNKPVAENSTQNREVQAVTPQVGLGAKVFHIVEIPAMLTKPEDRAEYLAKHYWNNFDFSDTAFMHIPEVTEQAFADFLSVLSHTTLEVGTTSIESKLERCITEDKTHKMYPYFLDLYQKYLNDPNSPFRDEELYICITEFIMNDSLSDESIKSRASFENKMMLKNRLGTKASNFTYTRMSGGDGDLYQLKKIYTLIYFYNPGCVACQEVKDYLNNSSIITHLLKKGMIDILAVYTDAELDKWKEYKDKIPAEWINVYDKSQDIIHKQIYDLKAIPTIYLLDKDKIVLLKDADAASVESYLETNLIINEK